MLNRSKQDLASFAIVGADRLAGMVVWHCGLAQPDLNATSWPPSIGEGCSVARPWFSHQVSAASEVRLINPATVSVWVRTVEYPLVYQWFQQNPPA